MALLTKDQIERIPNLYDQDGKGENAIVYVKITCANATWLITECCQESGTIAFGFADLFKDSTCGELGYISLEEIQELKGKWNVIVEEVNRPLKEMKAEIYA